jgi:hypothetical protein
MHTSLQRVDQPDTLNTSHVGDQKENQGIEEGQHLHLPQPSVWPLLLSGAILLCISGLLVLPNIPWLSIIALPFVLAGTVGWALEDPRAPSAFPQSAPLSTLASALVEQAHHRQEEGDRPAPPHITKRQFLGPVHGQIGEEHDSPVTVGRMQGDRPAPPRITKHQFLGPVHEQVREGHHSPVTAVRTQGSPYPASPANRGMEHEDFTLASYDAVEVEARWKEMKEVVWQGNEAQAGGDPSGSRKSFRRIVWRPF